VREEKKPLDTAPCGTRNLAVEMESRERREDSIREAVLRRVKETSDETEGKESKGGWTPSTVKASDRLLSLPRKSYKRGKKGSRGKKDRGRERAP